MGFDYLSIRKEINLAFNFGPTDAGLFVLRGVIYTMLDDPEQANQDFTSAEKLAGNHSSYLQFRSQYWLEAGDYQKALTDASELIQKDPTSAEGFFYLGRANEFLKNYPVAIDAYEKAANLADSQGKAELTASIRVLLAMLMESVPGSLPGAQTATAP